MITTLVGAAEPPRPAAVAWTTTGTNTITTGTPTLTWPATELARPPYRTTAYVGEALPEIGAR